MKIFCPACSGEFEMDQSVIHDREACGVRFRYMACPHCKAAYLISAIDDEMRKAMQGRMPAMGLRAMSERKKLEHFALFSKSVPHAQEGSIHGYH